MSTHRIAAIPVVHRIYQRSGNPFGQPRQNRVPQRFFLGVPLRVGLSRSIFPGAGRSTVSKHQTCRRAQKGYSRISLTRFASCIAARSPAIAAAQRVCSACAPEITPHLCLVAYVYLRSLPAVCADLSQACEAFLPFARSFRRRANHSRRLHGAFAHLRKINRQRFYPSRVSS